MEVNKKTFLSKNLEVKEDGTANIFDFESTPKKLQGIGCLPRRYINVAKRAREERRGSNYYLAETLRAFADYYQYIGWASKPIFGVTYHIIFAGNRKKIQHDA